jgi:hypothetical protein
MDEEKTITIPEDTYAQLMGQAAFLRAAVHALGGQYEITFDNMRKNGAGPLELRGDPMRQTLSCHLVEREDDE